MTRSDFVSTTARAARGQWSTILQQLNITVPANYRQGPCPVCGGKDRFRFDDKEGRGTWICNQCPRAGDGLDLVAKVKQCTLKQAAEQVQGLSLNPMPAREKAIITTVDIGDIVRQLLTETLPGTSAYLQRKGLPTRHTLLTAGKQLTINNITFTEGTLVLPLKNIDGNITGAQLIDGEGNKRLLHHSQAAGSFITVQTPLSPPLLLLCEGYATALSLALALPECAVYAALSANNLRNVALLLRQCFPDLPFILAGDNGHVDGQQNIGKISAENAAKAVNGRVCLPPGNMQADWDDYRQEQGFNALRQQFLPLFPTTTTTTLLPTQNTMTDNQTPPPIFLSKLPLRMGSSGYDTRQDYTIKDHLPANSLVSLYGPSGSYKSFLALSWACHIATGKPWAGKRVNAGAVIYVVGEGGMGVSRRIRAWEMTLNDASPIETLYRIDCPIFPANPDSVHQVIQAVREVEAKTKTAVRLIILDTLARCFGGADENAAKDMGAFIQGCDTIKVETNATVVIIHHSGKDQDKGARGSSAFRAAMDAEFNIRREGEHRAITLNCTKMKDAEEPPRLAYDCHPLLR